MEPIRVVVAEDDERARALVCRWLQFEPRLQVVAEARDGAEAIARAEAEAPDIVLLDLDMPHVNGVEAISHIRRRAPRAKIVIFSGSEPDRESLIRQGADLVLIKFRDTLTDLPVRLLSLFE